MSWEMVELREVCEVVSGATPKREVAAYWNGDIDWVTPKDLTDLEGKYIDEAPEKITEEGYNSCSTHLLPPGSVLLSSRAPIGHLAITKRPVCTNQGFKNFVPGPQVDAEYLYWALKRDVPKLQAMGTGSTFKEISKAQVEKYKIPLPPLPTQRRIAAVLDKAQALVANDRQTVALYDQLAKSLFLEMFGNPVRNERGWAKQRLADLCQSIVVGFVGACEKYYTGSEGIPMVRTGNLREGYLDFSNLKYVTHEFHLKQRKSQLRKGDILIARHGDNGKASLYDGRFENANSLNIVVLRPDPIKMLPQFLITVMNDQSMRTLIASRTGGATQKVVNTKEIQKLEFIAPPLPVQQGFVVRLDRLNAHRAQAEQSLRQSEGLFGSLLHGAFAGASADEKGIQRWTWIDQ